MDDQVKIKLMGHTNIETTRRFYIKNRRSDEELLEKVSGIQEFQTDYRNHQVLLQEVPTGSHPS